MIEYLSQIFLNMDKKKYFKGTKGRPVRSQLKRYFLRFQKFVFTLEYAKEHRKPAKNL